MPVCGLVAVLEPAREQQLRALAALEGHGAITLGELQGDRLPLVIDTPDLESDQQLWRWLRELPDILHIDVVYVDASEDDASAPCSMKENDL